MILIDRGDEDAELSAIRASELARVEVIRQAGRYPTAKELGEEYKRARSTLRSRQRCTCCYCEKFAELRYSTVEHVRPKTQARRSDGRVEPGYWWLAWTWENLLFCCQQCNKNKDVWYPLRGDDQPPHRPLAERADPPGSERPLLLDPTRDDPTAHIQFRPVSGRWIPLPRDGSLRGYETIRRAQLDRSDLLELYGETVRALADSLERIRGAQQQAARPPSPLVETVWRDVLRGHLRRGAPLAALRYDVFDHAFPKMVRLRWGVSLDEFAGELTHRKTGA